MDKEKILAELQVHRYAHRGFHDKPYIPENSVFSFEAAVNSRFGIEFDVHMTLDRKLAVIHDSSLRRVTTVRSDNLAVTPQNMKHFATTITGCDALIEEITLAEAKQYYLEDSDEVIPEFREVLEVVNGKVPLIIEVKPRNGNERELIDLLMKELEGYSGLYCIASFNPLALLYLRVKYPEVVRGQIAADLRMEENTKSPGDPRERVQISRDFNILIRDLKMNKITKPDFVAYKFEQRRNSAIMEFDGPKFFWTITDELDMEIAERLGAACIFENFVPKRPYR